PLGGGMLAQSDTHELIRPPAGGKRVKENRAPPFFDPGRRVERSHQTMRTLGLLAVLVGMDARAAEPPARPATERSNPTPGRTVSATVVDQAGKPLPRVVVFAADAGKVIGMAQS